MKKINGNIASPKGFKADGIHCGLKRKRKDIGWIISTVPAQCAGVFTTNQVKAAPVLVTKENPYKQLLLIQEMPMLAQVIKAIKML